VPAPAAEAEVSAAADQNLAEMAQRLEAALRRPAKADGGRPPNEPAPRSVAETPDEAKEPDKWKVVVNGEVNHPTWPG